MMLIKYYDDMTHLSKKAGTVLLFTILTDVSLILGMVVLFILKAK